MRPPPAPQQHAARFLGISASFSAQRAQHPARRVVDAAVAAQVAGVVVGDGPRARADRQPARAISSVQDLGVVHHRPSEAGIRA